MRALLKQAIVATYVDLSRYDAQAHIVQHYNRQQSDVEAALIAVRIQLQLNMRQHLQ